jgi:hypothetical protein
MESGRRGTRPNSTNSDPKNHHYKTRHNGSAPHRPFGRRTVAGGRLPLRRGGDEIGTECALVGEVGRARSIGRHGSRVFYPNRPDRTGEVWYQFTGPVRSGTGRKPDEFKFEFKPRSTIGSDWYTDPFNRYTEAVRPVPGR